MNSFNHTHDSVLYYRTKSILLQNRDFRENILSYNKGENPVTDVAQPHRPTQVDGCNFDDDRFILYYHPKMVSKSGAEVMLHCLDLATQTLSILAELVCSKKTWSCTSPPQVQRLRSQKDPLKRSIEDRDAWLIDNQSITCNHILPSVARTTHRRS